MPELHVAWVVGGGDGGGWVGVADEGLDVLHCGGVWVQCCVSCVADECFSRLACGLKSRYGRKSKDLFKKVKHRCGEGADELAVVNAEVDDVMLTVGACGK